MYTFFEMYTWGYAMGHPPGAPRWDSRSNTLYFGNWDCTTGGLQAATVSPQTRQFGSVEGTACAATTTLTYCMDGLRTRLPCTCPKGWGSVWDRAAGPRFWSCRSCSLANPKVS